MGDNTTPGPDDVPVVFVMGRLDLGAFAMTEEKRAAEARAIEMLTLHLTCPNPLDLAFALHEIGFDPDDPAQLAGQAVAQLAASIMRVLHRHTLDHHGCDLAPVEVLRLWAQKSAEVAP